MPSHARPLRVAFVNNMPDSAFADTERQFLAVLGRAAGPGSVLVDRYLVDSVPRSGATIAGPARSYRPLADLYDTRPDAVIVTGTEPKAALVADEPLWEPLTELYAWAPEHTSSLLCSCLAAHIAARYFDGLERVSLPDKCWGLLPDAVDTAHELAAGLPDHVAFPHSRCNAIPTEPLLKRGYRPLVSDNARWTVATAERNDCLIVLVQGHPEYDADTLLREYRRDVRRYLRGERERFPPLPEGYLADAPREMLERFSRRAQAGPRDERHLELLPFDGVFEQLAEPWSGWATTLYANWLTGVARRSMEPAEFATTSALAS